MDLELGDVDAAGGDWDDAHGAELAEFFQSGGSISDVMVDAGDWDDADGVDLERASVEEATLADAAPLELTAHAVDAVSRKHLKRSGGCWSFIFS